MPRFRKEDDRRGLESLSGTRSSDDARDATSENPRGKVHNIQCCADYTALWYIVLASMCIARYTLPYLQYVVQGKARTASIVRSEVTPYDRCVWEYVARCQSPRCYCWYT